MTIDKNFNYSRALKDCGAILRYLSSYPDVLQKMEINELIDPDRVGQQYLDWKRLVANFEGIEKDHFKAYWLPIEADNFQFFIDLSSNNYTVKESIYINGGEKGDEYISYNLFFSINEFFEIIDDPQELEEYFDRHLMHRFFKYPHEVVLDIDNFNF